MGNELSSDNTDAEVKASSAKNKGAVTTESEIDHPTPEETPGAATDARQEPSEPRDPDAVINDANAISGKTGGASSFEPKAGDRVLVNGQIAELTAYSRESDIFTAIARAGNGTDRVTGHISNTRIEPLNNGGTNDSESDLDVPLKDTNWVSNPAQEGLDNGVLRVNAEVHNDLTASQTNSLGEHGSK